MDNSLYRSYSYCCTHLWYLWHKRKLSGKQILDLTVEMTEWFTETGIEYKWDTYTTNLPLEHSIDAGPYLRQNAQRIYLSNSVNFKYEEDLLAFRLRWGIQGATCIRN